MSCIAAIAEGGAVYMAGDSYASQNDQAQTQVAQKIFFLNEPESHRRVMVGIVGDGILLQILPRTILRPRQPEEDPNSYVCWAVCQAFLDNINAYGKKLNLRVGKYPSGRIIIGYDGQLFGVDKNFYVISPHDRMLTAGAGEDFAMGVIYTNEKLKPRQRVVKAIETAAYWTPYVSMPAYVQELPKGG